MVDFVVWTDLVGEGGIVAEVERARERRAARDLKPLSGRVAGFGKESGLTGTVW